ncbi:MAG TPA: hypothetical protein VIY47_06095 [Ignavibacteriaceae bacterium]
MIIKDDKGVEHELYSKEEYTAASEKASKLEKEVEDVRMEVLTPQYTAFLDSYNKGQSEGSNKSKEPPPGDEIDFEKLTKKQIFEMAKKAAVDEVNGTLTKKQQETQVERDKKHQKTIIEFAKQHEDFEKFRPTMYGLSLKEENQDLTISQLYTKAKEHVASLNGEFIKDKKRTSNERPIGDSQSFEKYKKMDAEAIGREALEEIKAQFGSIPSA